MAAIEELFLLLDQFWRTVAGIRAHRGDGDFLAAYCAHGRPIHREFEDLIELTAEEWKAILRLPTEADILAACDVDVEAAASWIRFANQVLRLVPVNVREVWALFERPTEVLGGSTEVSLRDANNRYRHGSRIVYEDSSPVTSNWIAANPERGVGLLPPPRP